MELRLFGDVQLMGGGRSLDVGTPRQQAVLAALAVDAGRPVAIETLIDRVWGDAPPVAVRNVLYSHVSRIRQLLRHVTGPSGAVGWIERRSAGYVLAVDPDVVDLRRFARLVEEGADLRSADGDRTAALTEALGLWRGPPLAGICGDWADQVRDSWHRRRLDAVVRWGELELKLGRAHLIISTVGDLVAEYPLAEPLECLLMRALHAAGRDAEALERFAVIRKRLADELGADPGPELRALHGAILRGELPAPDRGGSSSIEPVPAPPAVPRQLPAHTSRFAGRAAELEQLASFLDDSTQDCGGTAVITAIEGTAGVGKTALAMHWAHHVAQRFPDGQLYVNLRGFDPTGSPVAPAEAVRRFLDAFNVPAERIPTGFDAQVGLYRSLLAGRRVLVVLDNARDADQVRPLLPGARGCVVIVTSRNQLTGLVTEGAHALPLDLLPAADARELLARRLGDRRIAAEPHAVDEIVTLCARLPLALSIVAARAATHPGFSLTALAGELRAARGLDEFTGTDPATDARTVFSWSYRQLSPQAARLFRLLGLHPGPDISRPAVASLAGHPVGITRSLLAELARVHLLIEHTPGRYNVHDLLRAYATEQAHHGDTDKQRHDAIHRALDYYLHTSHTAARSLTPTQDPLPLTPPQPGVNPDNPADHRQALDWFTAEHAVLLAVIDHAARTGWDTHTWQLAWTLMHFLDRRGHWQDDITIQQAALAATQRLADPALQAGAHRFLGQAYTQVARFDDAGTHLQHALDLSHRCGDRVGQAYAHRILAVAVDRQGRHADALAHARQALDLFRAAGHHHGQAQTLNAIGWSHTRLGDHHQALTFCQQALALMEELGDRRGQANTWEVLGYAHHNLGHHTRAITCFHHAIDISQDLGDHFREAITYARLGDTHHAIGDPNHARDAWQAALTTVELLPPQQREVLAWTLSEQTPAEIASTLQVAPETVHSNLYKLRRSLSARTSTNEHSR